VCITQGFRCIAFGDFPQRSKRSFGLPSISRLFQRILLQKGAAGVGLAATVCDGFHIDVAVYY
jgi:hypothetical protein